MKNALPKLLLVATMLMLFINASYGDNESDNQMSNDLINKASWLVGSWTGEGLGGICEEVWFPPVDGTMMGMFRFIKDGKVGFYEFITISEEDGRLNKRLKHFNPDLTGWEEKDETVNFDFVSCTETELVFDGITVRKTGDDTMEIIVKSQAKDGTIKDLFFSYKRMD